jgi:hypothetical protein
VDLKKLDMWQSVQVFSLEMDKNNKFWEIYHKFLLADPNWFKPMALQRRHIMLQYAKILDLQV